MARQDKNQDRKGLPGCQLLSLSKQCWKQNSCMQIRCMNSAQPRCMNCIHWEIVKANCNVGCPERRMTGGTFAKTAPTFGSIPTMQWTMAMAFTSHKV